MPAHTKIYGTFGPSCEDRETLEAMVREGLDGMRLNLNHTSLNQSREKIEYYREACQALRVPWELMIDMHGPGQRTGWQPPIPLSEGENVLLQAKRGKDAYKVLSIPPLVLDALETGDHILFRDGAMELEVVEELEPVVRTFEEEDDTLRKRFLCRALRDGTVGSQQSIKVVGKEIYGPVLTRMDLENLDLAAELGVTAIMQPFVRDGADLEALREALRERNLPLKVFAKLESLQSLQNLSSILPLADVIVIARGDLGNAMPLWELPRAQKEVARQCRDAGKPFMVVTQMLDSMQKKPVPTRAEVLDIFNAVLDGAAYLMVTGETSVGRYPTQVIRYMVRTAREADQYLAL